MISERKSRSETEMGLTAAGKTKEGHNAGLSGRFRAQHNGEATGSMRSVQSGSKGENEKDRLLTAGR